MAEVIDDDLVLADGRRLGYRVRGSADGRPILYFHGQPASRLEADLIPDDVLLRHRARLVSFDRPGMGRSDIVPARDMRLDLPDAVALLDHLGISEAAVIGTSAGGPWALAFAASHPDRTRSVGLICASGPYDDERFMSEDDIEGHRELRAAGADAILPEYEEARDRMLSDVSAGVAEWFEDFPEAERRWAMTEPASTTLVTEVSEALRQGSRGWLRETEIRSLPWSFDVADIRAPVHALHGAADPWELISNIERVVAAIPGGRLTRIEGGSHLAPVMRAEEIVAAVVSAG